MSERYSVILRRELLVEFQLTANGEWEAGKKALKMYRESNPEKPPMKVRDVKLLGFV